MKTIVVAGITRSGLTLTMQMLDAGGYPCYGEYPGYEPYDAFKMPWDKIKGRAVKSVDTQHDFPDTGQDYHVIRLRRNTKEQVKSQSKFGAIFGMPVLNRSERKIIEKSNIEDYRKIDKWGKKQKGFMILDFEDLINRPMKLWKNIRTGF